MLNSIYLAVLLVASPWVMWSAWRHGKYREGFVAKFLGQVPARNSNRPCVWLHAVSVGEVNLLASTLREIAGRRSDVECVISTTTKAGYDLARQKYADHTVFYCPLDFSWAVSRAMRRIRPKLLVLAELELWPNLIAAAKSHGAKVAIINGRLSDKSFRGYARLRPLVAKVLRKVDLIAAQNDETADRFLKLGARLSAVVSTGSLKFDGAQTDRSNSRTRELRSLAQFGDDDQVFLAGSTQDPEEAMAVRIFQELVTEFPRLKLVLVPRHPQRFDEVAEMLDRSGLSWIRRSELNQPAISSRSSTTRSASRLTEPHSTIPVPKSAILLVDTVGELGAWWGTATVGFVGGSFGSRGGQNMLEPAAYGVATCFGPNTWNFRDIVSQLLKADGAQVVNSEAELSAFVRRVLEDPAWAGELGRRARQLVLSQQGATGRTVELLLPLLKQTIAARRAA
jgi:3-deoxy-D-manno-octulosonic-acid transferase